MSDPVYHAASFWDLPCSYLEDILESLQKIEKDRLQAESLTTAYLTDTVLMLAHSIYGDKSKGGRYESKPERFLPGYSEPTQEIKEIRFEPDLETMAILLEEIRGQRVPSRIVANFTYQIGDWIKKVEKNVKKM